MSSQSPQSAASADLARSQANLANQLGNVAIPELGATIDAIRRDLGSGGIPQSIADTFSQARAGLNQDFTSAGNSQQSLLRQRALQSGQRFTGAELSGAERGLAINLDQQRTAAQRNLQYQESQAGLTQYNQLLGMLGAGSGAAFNLARGFSGNQAGALSGLSNTSPLGGALGGAATGAAAGSYFGPYGTAIGAAAGGLGGYFYGGG